MSSLIKADSVGPVDGEAAYVIDCESEKGIRRRRRAKPASPADEARLIVEQAKDEAAAMIAEAQRQVETIRAAAHEEGYQSGLQQLEAQKAAMDQRLAEIEADVQRQIAEFWTSIEPELLELAVEIGRKIVRHEFAENSDFVLATVKAGLRQLRDRREVKIRVNPDDYKFMREHKEDLASSFDGVRSLELIEDRRVDRGGCVIESTNGHLDARTETQLGEVERALSETAHDG